MIFYYLAGTSASLLLAAIIDNIALKVLFCWTALSLAAVTIAYTLNKPGLFRKQQNGSIPLPVRFLLTPFLLGTHVYNYWARKTDGIPSLNLIESGIYLGNRITPADVPDLLEQRILSVLDVTAEFNAFDWSVLGEDIEYLNIPVLDHSVPEKNQCIQAINWIHNQVTAQRNVLVHCALGRGRSAFFVAAYLISRSETAIVDEMDKLQRIRNSVRLNHRQLNTLTAFHREGVLRIRNTGWIIANPASGAGKWLQHRKEIEQLMHPHLQLKIVETDKSLTASELTRKAITANANIVIACGGDGTVTEVASQLIGKNVKLGIIPLGTTNALSHVLWGIHSKISPIQSACDLIIRGETRRIDTANCNGRMMLLLAGVGFQQRMMEAADRKAKDQYGQLAYILGLWDAISQNEVMSITLSVDGSAPRKIQTCSLVIANAAPITTLLAQGSGEPDLTDGKLDITWIDPVENSGGHVFSFAELLIAGFSKSSTNYNVHHIMAERVEFTTSPLSKYVIDGEVYDAEPLKIEIIPRSLEVFSRS